MIPSPFALSLSKGVLPYARQAGRRHAQAERTCR